MICAIDDDECLGAVDPVGAEALCQFHGRVLGELGYRAFREWYSIELAAAQGIEAAPAAETPKSGSVHESPVGNADAPEEDRT